MLFAVPQQQSRFRRRFAHIGFAKFRFSAACSLWLAGASWRFAHIGFRDTIMKVMDTNTIALSECSCSRVWCEPGDRIRRAAHLSTNLVFFGNLIWRDLQAACFSNRSRGRRTWRQGWGRQFCLPICFQEFRRDPQVVSFANLQSRLADLARGPGEPHTVDGIVLTKMDAIDDKVSAFCLGCFFIKPW